MSWKRSKIPETAEGRRELALQTGREMFGMEEPIDWEELAGRMAKQMAIDEIVNHLVFPICYASARGEPIVMVYTIENPYLFGILAEDVAYNPVGFLGICLIRRDDEDVYSDEDFVIVTALGESMQAAADATIAKVSSELFGGARFYHYERSDEPGPNVVKFPRVVTRPDGQGRPE